MATTLQCFVKRIPANLIVLLANECEKGYANSYEQIVPVDAALCGVTLTAAIKNVPVNTAKSITSQTAASNNATMATASSYVRLASLITRYATKTRPHAAL